MVKRKGRLSEKIETLDNFRVAEDSYADDKRKRHKVVKFERDLEGNLSSMLASLKDGTWQPAEYHDKEIIENHKHRKLCIYPVEEHIMEWAHTLHIEKLLTDTYVRSSCSCVQGRGQTDFIKLIYHDLWNDYDGTYYYVQLDAHHFFPLVCHDILKRRLERKIKDQKVLNFLFDTIDNYPNGIVLGTKLSQIEGNFYIAPLDHQIADLFGITDDPERMAYWRNRYVTDCIVTCRTESEAAELNKGVKYLNAKFDRLCVEWKAKRYCYRFADNILMLCSDKTFLHLVVEMVINTLWHDYKVQVNRSWNVRPVEPDGIDICGYVLFHDHIRVRKRDKQALCRQVARLRKKGLEPEQIRLKAASRLGWCLHADARNLVRKLDVNMTYTRLGKAIKKNRHHIPFEGVNYEQKEPIEALLCMTENDEKSRMIMLYDFKVESSIIHTGEKCLWIRYRHVTGRTLIKDKDGKPMKDTNGNDMYEYELDSEEHYCSTGSKTLIDQAENDIDRTLLPMPTCIYKIMNNKKTSYYKFT